jgi:hypothetical protein
MPKQITISMAVAEAHRRGMSVSRGAIIYQIRAGRIPATFVSPSATSPNGHYALDWEGLDRYLFDLQAKRARLTVPGRAQP